MATAYEQHIMRLSPTAYWPLQDASGTTATDLVGSNAGTYVNTPTLGGRPGPVGDKFASFNGTDEHVTVGAGTLWNSTGAMSMSAWCRYTGDYAGADAYPAIMKIQSDQATAFGVSIGAGGANYRGVIFGSSSNFLTAESPSQASSTYQNTWRHVVVTFDGVDRTALGSYTLYVDGASVVIEAAGVFTAVANATRIANDATATTWFTGGLAHLALFGAELSAAQVKGAYMARLEQPHHKRYRLLSR